ncbi:uncharacterized protein LOC125501700 [Athalia rosae]|uniref:uncharacterized protein LOC125501700 n=1 Tax=Athalia rosae TaxID=37344 RepID=UPI0020341BB9|nr:uncharacterized protein LOC125501700 [Athalia rosae]
MALCDSKYRCRLVDVGAQGRSSDGEIGSNSEIGRNMSRGKMRIPPEDNVGSKHVLSPYVFVVNEAFELSEFMMRPCTGRGGLLKEKAVFNYRLSRARRLIENSFAILAAQ